VGRTHGALSMHDSTCTEFHGPSSSIHVKDTKWGCAHPSPDRQAVCILFHLAYEPEKIQISA